MLAATADGLKVRSFWTELTASMLNVAIGLLLCFPSLLYGN